MTAPGRPRFARPLLFAGLSAALFAALFAGLPAATPPLHAGEPPWSDAPYSHYPQNSPLDTVLKDFAGSFSLSLKLGAGVGGSVNGRFTAKNPTEFINRLASVYGFNWFTHAGTLFVSRADEQKTAAIPAANNGTGQLRSALASLGVLDSRFGWGELPEQGVALVSGPPAYVDLVERTVRSLPSVAGGQQVAVFRLKHAAVDDRTVFFRDKEITTPGLASILRSLILGNSGGGRQGVNNEALAGVAAPLRAGTPLLAEPPPPAPPGAAPGSPAAAAAAGSSGVRTRTPSIQADIRLNSLIIQDIPERIPMYERLIRELDVPTALIEIQAMIVDVNSQRIDELGIDWGGRANRGALGFGNPGAASTGTLSMNWAAIKGSVNPATLAVESGNYLVTRIRALEGLGEARIESRPSVLTLDNQGALFDHSETYYVRIQGERVANVTPVTAGTTLRVTPRVVDAQGQQTVQLVVDIEDGKIQDKLVDALPTVLRSSISTQALVNENQTLVIGGYSSEQNVQRTDRVPLLGAIPLAGALFTNKTVDQQKRERLFLIKPRIIALPADGSLAIPAFPPAGGKDGEKRE